MKGILSDILAIEGNPLLREEGRFVERSEAMDVLEFDVMERLEGLLRQPDSGDGPLAAKRRAERARNALEEVDAALFRRLRSEIRRAGRPGDCFWGILERHVGTASREDRRRGGAGFDNLDAFVNGLLCPDPAPAETRDREPEMVFFQKTPARIVLEMAEKARPGGNDVFYDLGSGLGQVALLAHLLWDIPAKGVELEPAYCGYARACAEGLGLSGVEFIEADARAVEYSPGTIFFLYTPFTGRMLSEAVGRILQGPPRPIRLFTLGPCTLELSRDPRLGRVDANGGDVHSLAEFIPARPRLPGPSA